MNEGELQETYEAFEGVFGCDLNTIQQGDDAWLNMKLGVISSSNFHKILNPKSETCRTYMMELVAQVVKKAAADSISSRATDWGHANEPEARSKYAFLTDSKVVEYPFIYKDKTMRIGRSPDGIVLNEYGEFVKEVEIKSPYNTVHHLNFLIYGTIKDEYLHQCQSAMWITGLDSCDFISYDNRLEDNDLLIKTMDANYEIMTVYQEVTEEFIYKMDKILLKMGLEFGSQWDLQEYKKLQEKV